jgi:hypothetical protein
MGKDETLKFHSFQFPFRIKTLANFIKYKDKNVNYFFVQSGNKIQEIIMSIDLFNLVLFDH